MFLDFADDQARRRKQIFMHDWREKLDDFLRFNDRDVLPHAGSVERKHVDAHATNQYQAFAARRRAPREQAGADDLAELASKLERVPRPDQPARRAHRRKDEQ